MKIKTSELIGRELDTMVTMTNAQALGTILWHSSAPWVRDDEGNVLPYTPSESWSQGGPIIERERINIQPVVHPEGWIANDYGKAQEEGPTPLIAAMRCYVAIMIGDEVDIPDKLCDKNTTAKDEKTLDK